MSMRTFNLRGNRRLLAGLLAVLAFTTVAALLAVIVLPATGRPAHANPNSKSPDACFADTGSRCTTTGPDASAHFGSVSSDDCLFSSAEIQPFQSLTRPGNMTSQSVLVLMSVFDACSGVQVMGATNFDSSTQDLNFTGTIAFGPQLSTARVSGTATMFDDFSNTTFTATIDVTWQGYGPTTRSFDSGHFRAPGVIVNQHFNATSRAAEASGVLSNGSANFAATPTLDAELHDVTTGLVQLIKQ